MKKKLMQFFCRHKKTNWYKKESMFQSLSGERHYLICEKCGKEVDDRFFEYEGMGFK